MTDPHPELTNTPSSYVELIDVSMLAREEHFFVPVALTIAAHRRCVQLAGAPVGRTDFFHLTLLLAALRAAIWSYHLDAEPAVLSFSITLPGELAPVPLRCVCEPEPFGGFIIGLDSDALGPCGRLQSLQAPPPHSHAPHTGSRSENRSSR